MKKLNEKANFSTMTKTKEEIIIPFMPCIMDRNFSESEKLNFIIIAMEEYGSQCRKEGFETSKANIERAYEEARAYDRNGDKEIANGMYEAIEIIKGEK
jgi:hypothetical protein